MHGFIACLCVHGNFLDGAVVMWVSALILFKSQPLI